MWTLVTAILATIGALIGLWLTWLKLPPKLCIEGTVDKSKKFNSESKIKIKNIGKLSAINVKADVENLCAGWDSVQMENCGFQDFPNVIGSLPSDESTEISVRPHITFEQGKQMTKFSYILTLKYQVKILLFKIRCSRKWKIELRRFEDGYTWEVTNI